MFGFKNSQKGMSIVTTMSMIILATVVTTTVYGVIAGSEKESANKLYAESADMALKSCFTSTVALFSNKPYETSAYLQTILEDDSQPLKIEKQEFTFGSGDSCVSYLLRYNEPSSQATVQVIGYGAGESKKVETAVLKVSGLFTFEQTITTTGSDLTAVPNFALYVEDTYDCNYSGGHYRSMTIYGNAFFRGDFCLNSGLGDVHIKEYTSGGVILDGNAIIMGDGNGGANVHIHDDLYIDGDAILSDPQGSYVSGRVIAYGGTGIAGNGTIDANGRPIYNSGTIQSLGTSQELRDIMADPTPTGYIFNPGALMTAAKRYSDYYDSGTWSCSNTGRFSVEDMNRAYAKALAEGDLFSGFLPVNIGNVSFQTSDASCSLDGELVGKFAFVVTNGELGAFYNQFPSTDEDSRVFLYLDNVQTGMAGNYANSFGLYQNGKCNCFLYVNQGEIQFMMSGNNSDSDTILGAYYTAPGVTTDWNFGQGSLTIYQDLDVLGDFQEMGLFIDDGSGDIPGDTTVVVNPGTNANLSSYMMPLASKLDVTHLTSYTGQEAVEPGSEGGSVDPLLIVVPLVSVIGPDSFSTLTEFWDHKISNEEISVSVAPEGTCSATPTVEVTNDLDLSAVGDYEITISYNCNGTTLTRNHLIRVQSVRGEELPSSSSTTPPNNSSSSSETIVSSETGYGTDLIFHMIGQDLVANMGYDHDDDITEWHDAVLGYNQKARQQVSSYKPDLAENAVFSLSAVDFNGDDEFFIYDELPISTAFTFFIVFKNESDNDGTKIFGAYNGGSNTGLNNLYIDICPTGELAYGYENSNGFNYSTSEVSIEGFDVLNEYQLLTIVDHGNTFDAYRNGIMVKDGSVAPGTSKNIGNGTIGCDKNSNGYPKDCFDGEIAEIKVYDYALTSTDVATQNAALVEKYNLAGTNQTPYGGSPHTIPAKIDMGHFDEGGNNIAYFDNSSGNNTGSSFRNNTDVDTEWDNGPDTYIVANTEAGEWLEYTINSTTDDYDIDVKYSCNFGQTKSIDVYVDENLRMTASNLTCGFGWTDWKTITLSGISIPRGEHVVKVLFNSSNTYFASLNFKNRTSGTQTPYSGHISIDNNYKINMNKFDNGGEGVAYHEVNTSGYNNNGVTRTSSDVDFSSYGSTIFLSNTEPGEWLEYSIDADGSASYRLGFRYSCDGYSDKGIKIYVDDVLKDNMDLKCTGYWTYFNTKYSGEMSISSGQHILKIEFEDTGLNVDYMVFYDDD